MVIIGQDRGAKLQAARAGPEMVGFCCFSDARKSLLRAGPQVLRPEISGGLPDRLSSAVGPSGGLFLFTENEQGAQKPARMTG